MKPGTNMPDIFFTANSRGLRGGVEYGFISTTDQKDTALHYATGGVSGTSGAGVMIETTMSMSARGANIVWLSQFQSQKELLFPPLCGYDVHAVRLVPMPADSGGGEPECILWLECSLVIPNWLTLQQALERTPRFLDRFELAPGAPLHISRTAAVLAASEALQDDKRRVALKFMCEPLQARAAPGPSCARKSCASSDTRPNVLGIRSRLSSRADWVSTPSTSYRCSRC